jgi:hypothetical protein
VVIATGAGSFVPRKLPLPGAEEREGTSLFYVVLRMEDNLPPCFGVRAGRQGLSHLVISGSQPADAVSYATGVESRLELIGQVADASLY